MSRAPTIARLRGCATLASLPEEVLTALAEGAEAVSLRAGEAVITQGDLSADLYVQLDGEMEIIRETGSGEATVLRRTQENVLLGEMQSLTGGHRTATVRAVSDTSLLKIGAEHCRAVAARHPVLLERLADHAHARLRRNQLFVALRLRYHDVGDDLLNELLGASVWLHLERGETLVRQGEESDAVYFLLQGRLIALREEAGQTDKLGEILPGETLGEAAVLPGQTRGATVVATRPSDLARISKGDFSRIADAHPALLRRILEVTLARHQSVQAPERRPMGAHTIAIVPLSPSVPIASFVEKLSRALDEPQARRIDRKAVQERFGQNLADEESDGARIRLGAWFDQLESRDRVLLFEADPPGSVWSRRCASMADEIVLVGLADEHPRAQALEKLFAREQAHIRPRLTLVLLHPGADAAPRNTARWMDAHPVESVLHVRSDKDYGRVARFLTGKAIGLVLSGGAARSFAGIGVLRALREVGVPVDAIGGVSAGALVSALFASGRGEEEMMESIKRLGMKMLLKPDLTLPMVSLLSARGFAQVLEEAWGDIGVEDLLLPCLIVSSNITQARLRVGTRGKLVEHLLATNSMPVLMPPAVIDGDLHADGALLNNTPIAEMKQLVRGGPVIAMDVTPSVEFDHNEASRRGLSGWKVLGDWIQGREPATQANALSIMLRSQLLHHVSLMREVRKLADLYLQPDVRQYGFMQYYQYRAIAALGYQQSLDPIRQWWRSPR